MTTDEQCWFVTCVKGLEEVLAAELRGPEIGARDVRPGAAGVHFRGGPAVGYRANLWLRTGVRVLREQARAHVEGPEELYEWARTIPWREYMNLEQTFSVEARVRDSKLTHSQYAALRIKDALCDTFRDHCGRRPNVDARDADLPLFLYLYRDEAVLYHDTSGTTLHKRGYRDVLHRASLNECVAAGIIGFSGWDQASPLVDPMCGAGTLVIEAALKALRRAPGLLRKKSFPFQRRPDFDRRLWKDCRGEAYARALYEAPCFLGGNDLHPGALSLARKDAEAAGVAQFIEFTDTDIADYHPAQTPRTVVVNPPWGGRLDEGSVAEAWKKLGLFLKQRCPGTDAWLLTGNASALQYTGLKISRKIPLRYGKVSCRLVHCKLATEKKADVRGDRPLLG